MALRKLYTHIRENLQPGRFGRRMSLTLAQSLIETGCLTLTVLVVARLFGVELFGRLGLYLVAVQFVSMLTDGLLASEMKSISQEAVTSPAAGSSAAWYLSWRLIATVGVIVGFLALAAIVILPATHAQLLVWLAAATAITRVAKNAFETAFRALGNFGAPMRFGSGLAVIQMVAAISAAVAGYRVATYLAILTVFQLMNFLCLVAVFARRYDRRAPTTDNHFNLYRQMVAYASPLIMSGFIGFFNLRANVPIIAYFAGETQVGYYRLAEQFLNVATLVIASVMTPYAPRVAEFCKTGDMKALDWLKSKVTGALVIVALPMTAGFLVIRPLIAILFPGYEPAIPIIQVFAFLPLIYALYYPSSVTLAQGGRSGAAAIISGAASIVTVVAAALLARQYGAIGPAAATTAIQAIAGAASIIACLKFFPLTFSFRFR